MATFRIYYGAEKPIIAVGKNQVKLLQFLERFPCWHSMAKDRRTQEAVKGLERKGCIERDKISGMVRFCYPTKAKAAS